MQCVRSFYPEQCNGRKGKRWTTAIATVGLLTTSLFAVGQTPVATITGLPAEPLINEEFCFDVAFTNSAATTGYGPYLIGGVDPNITITSANFVDVSPTIDKIGDFDASGQLVDPISGITINGEQGGAAWDIRYPVGSVENNTPPLVLTACGVVDVGAEIDLPLDIGTIPGFEFGDTPTGTTAIVGSQINSTVTPRLARVEKTNTAPENERPPGPSHVFNYIYSVNISDGVTLDNFSLEDNLPAEIQWTGTAPTISAPTSVGCGVTQNANFPPTAGGTVIIECTAASGTTATGDVVVTLPVYITDILDETRPDSQTITNTVNVEYDYQSTPYNDSDTSDVLALHAAIQKTSSVGPRVTALPGDNIDYTVSFQLTDYPGNTGSGAIQFVITDTFPDGLEFVGTLDLVVAGTSYPITPTVTPAGGGITTVEWDIADALGGVLPDGGDGELIYRTLVLDTYSNGQPVQDADALDNNAMLDYTLDDGATGDNGTVSPGGIEPAVPDKTIVSPSPLPAELGPGDEVIFRLTLDLAAGDTEDVILTDYLPRPVFDVLDPASFDQSVDILDPGAGFIFIPPAVTVDGSANSVSLSFGDIRADAGDILGVDIRARITTEPFADNLFLTNLMGSSYSNTAGDVFTQTDAVGLNVGAPVMTITKAAIDADNPAATFDVPPPANPATALADSNIADVDAADVVTFLLTVENTGGQNAYDVTVTDPAIAAMSCDMGSIAVRDGLNNTLAFTGDLLTGLVLTNPLPGNDNNPAGGGAPYTSDTALISYDCTLAADVVAGRTYTNTATVIWNAAAGGTSPYPPASDDATVTIGLPSLAKSVTSVFPGYSSTSNSPHIGELVTYTLEITVPEGSTPASRLLDTLDEGLAFVDVQSLTATAGVSTDVAGGFSAIAANAGFLAVGSGTTAPDRRLAFGPAADQNGFGTITNSDSDNATADVITLVYRTRVINSDGNVSGLQLRNNAQWSWESESALRQTVSRRASPVSLVEPQLLTTKTFAPNTGDDTTPPVLTITLGHSSGSTADAFDVVFTDNMPVPLEIASVDSSACSATTLTATPGDSMIEATWDQFSQGDTCTLVITTAFSSTITAGTTLNNCVDASWQSLSVADQPLPTPPNNTLGAERTGDPADTGGTANTYTHQTCADFKIYDLDITKTVLASSQAQTDHISGLPAETEALTIGEEVTFELVVTVPEAPALDVRVTDVLPNSNMKLEVTGAATTQVGADLSPRFPDPIPVFSDGDGDGINDTIELDYGRIAHTLDAATNDRDRIRIEVFAVVLDVADNENGDFNANTGLVSSRNVVGRSDKTASDTYNIELVEPQLQLAKNGDVSQADAGDIITYTLAVSHSSSSRVDAEDLFLTDTLPAELDLIPGSAMTVAGCSATPTVLNELGNTINVGWDSFPLRGYCVIGFQAEVNISAVTDSTITNTGTLEWTSLVGSGDVNDRTYSTNSSWDIIVSPPGLRKVVVDTSNPITQPIAGSSVPNLTIGEEVTFAITASFADGTTRAVVVEDTLPSGTVNLQVVSSQLLAIGSDLTLSSGITLGQPGGACATPSPSCVAWDLGDVIDLPDSRADFDPEDNVVFEVVAIVLDDAANDGRGNNDKNLSNTAHLRSPDASLSALSPFNLVEPHITLRKLTSNGTPLDATAAGDIEEFTLVITHETDSTAAGANLVITDVLNAGSLWINDSTVSSDCPLISISVSPAPGTSGDVEFQVPVLPLVLGQCQITYEVEMRPDLPIAGSFPNTAELAYESSFLSAEARSYNDTALAELVSYAEAHISKNIVSSSVAGTTSSEHDPLLTDLTIGEVVEFRITTLLAEGTTEDVVLSDTLPQSTSEWLEFVGGRLISLGRNITASPAVPLIVGDTISVNYGTVVNQADGIADDGDQIVYQLLARVTDRPANQDGDVITNTATIEYQLVAGGPVERLDSSVDMDVVEPELVLGKQFGAIQNARAQVDLELSNTGTAPAYEVVITDEFDHTFWIGGSLQRIDVPAGFELRESFSGGFSTIALLPIGAGSAQDRILSPGELLNVSFSMALQNNGDLGVPQIDNTAVAEANSLPLPNADGRSVNASASDSLLFPNLDVEKAWSGQNSPALPGDTLTYTLTLTNSGGAALTNVIVDDTPDAIGEFQAGSVAASGGGTVTSGNSPGDSDISVEFTTIGGGETRTITYDVRIPLPYPSGMVAPQELQNQAVAQSDELADVLSDDPATTAVDDATIVPIEADPIMTLDKRADRLITPAGTDVIYTLTYGNAGNQDATGVVINETVPANTTFNAASSDSRWDCGGATAAGTPCTLTIGDLAGAGSGSVLFVVTIDNPVPAAVGRIVNTADVAEDGVEFTGPSTPSTASDDAQTLLFAQPLLEVIKDDGGITVVPGQAYAFGIQVQNIGTQESTGIVISETVPNDVVFSSAASAPDVWSCADGSPAGTPCTLLFGDLMAGMGGVRQFGVEVIDPAAAGVDLVMNTASIEDDGSNSPLPQTDSDDDDTPLIAQPDLVIDKSTTATNVTENTVIVYELDYRNVGNQPATNVVIDEVVPERTEFSAADSTPGWSCPDASPARTLCVFDLGTLNVNANGTVLFAVTVVDRPSQTVASILNVAVIRDDGANGPDPTPLNNIDNVTVNFRLLKVPALNIYALALLIILAGVLGSRYARLAVSRRSRS